MEEIDYAALATELEELLKLQSPALAIGFSHTAPAGVPAFAGERPAPSADGRTGKVTAGCVFWMHAARGAFTTVPADHGNCSVGSLTHGLKTLEEAARGADVAAVVEAGWVRPELFPQIPAVKERFDYISYGPLKQSTFSPDVVFLRLYPKQLMMLHEAVPELRLEGKPQCHIVAIAKEQGEPAVSVGCMLSRVRTGMSNNEVTCALPAKQLPEVVERLRAVCAADAAVAGYASEDARRFRPS